MTDLTAIFLLSLVTLCLSERINTDPSDLDDKVISGQDVRTTETFPFVAALVRYFEYENDHGIIDSNRTTLECGGTILADRWILTAAHCLWFVNGDFRVKVGLTKLHCDESSAQIRKMKAAHLHPEYDESTTLNDIALVELDSALVFNAHVQPASLPSKDYPITGKPAILTGWGTRGEAATVDECNTLQSGVLYSYEQKECQLRFPDLLRRKSTICAGHPHPTSPSSCSGDSGSGLVVEYNTRSPVVIGVVSFGRSRICTNYPSAYTDVRLFAGWIREKIGG